MICEESSIIQEFFRQIGENDLDSEIVNYVTSTVAEEASSDSADHDVVVDMISVFSEKFSIISHPQQEKLVSDLILNFKTLKSASTEKSTANVTTHTKSSSNNIDVTDHHLDNDDQGQQQQETTLENQALELLASMCPFPAPQGFLEYVLYRQCSSNLEQAADKLLILADTDQLRSEIKQWTQAEEKKMAETTTENELDESLRRSIIKKFHLVAVAEPSSISSSGKHHRNNKEILAAWGEATKKNQQNKQKSLRYRDGVVVANKGEKYIIEKEAEWDGGSRGRVKSKRKGGKGWI